jgi:hypothetical protein
VSCVFQKDSIFSPNYRTRSFFFNLRAARWAERRGDSGRARRRRAAAGMARTKAGEAIGGPCAHNIGRGAAGGGWRRRAPWPAAGSVLRRTVARLRDKGGHRDYEEAHPLLYSGRRWSVTARRRVHEAADGGNGGGGAPARGGGLKLVDEMGSRGSRGHAGARKRKGAHRRDGSMV